MSRLALAAAALLLTSSAAGAQTIRPLISEFQREARGRFEVANDSDRPLNVVLEPRGFSLGEDGQMRDEPPPVDLRITVSASSFRLPPRQSRFVFYEATSARAPAWFVLYANLTGFPSREFSGLNVQLELPHVVYILPKEPWKAGDLRVLDVDWRPEARTLSLVVENRGATFGRVAGVKVLGAGSKVDVQGFPLFPGGRRRLEVAWEGDAEPESISVDARSFSFEHRLPRADR